MKNSLLFIRVALSINIIFSWATLSGQVLLSENFSGFSSGTHGTPSTSDVASTLDSKTTVPGWTGSLIYSAGGEVKIGTSSLTGWIETPGLDLSPNGGNFTVSFDICRWPGDATTVQVYLNGSAIGNPISPSDVFQNIQITGTGGTISGKIKLMALTKRFFIDNFSVRTNLPTEDKETKNYYRKITIYPVPVIEELTVSNIYDVRSIEIFDISGRKVVSIKTEATDIVRIPMKNFKEGLYIARFNTARGIEVIKLIKK